MVYSPRFILYVAVKNYLTEEQLEKLRTDIAKKSVRGDKTFLGVIKKHFDMELFRTKPFIWQDIWLYNYLMYDVKTIKFPKVGLITKYEREIILPQKKILEQAKEILTVLNT